MKVQEMIDTLQELVDGERVSPDAAIYFVVRCMRQADQNGEYRDIEIFTATDGKGWEGISVEIINK